VRFLTATNDIFSTESKHYVTLLMACPVPDVEVTARELECTYRGVFGRQS
jgi:hypothetical protein